jgi:hypothetical protein
MSHRKQAQHIAPVARPIARVTDSTAGLRGLVVGLDDEGRMCVVPLDLESAGSVEVDAIAKSLEEMAAHLRDGWRGRASAGVH